MPIVSSNIDRSFDMLQLLKYRLLGVKDDLFYVTCYQNGRENGFTVHSMSDPNRSVTFCEYRRTDDIVVYLDSNELQGISDEAYNNKKFFQKEIDAVIFMEEHLIA